MKALLPLLIPLLLFAACTSKPAEPDSEDPVSITIPETPPPEFFEMDHSYTEIHPNVFSFEVLDETGNVTSINLRTSTCTQENENVVIANK